MEIENLRKQEPGGNDPFQGNRWFRIAIIVLGALAVIGVLIFLLIILGFCAPNRQTSANPTTRPPATAVVIVETQAPPTAAPATATLVLAPTASEATAAANAQPTNAPPAATETAAQPTAAQPTRGAIATQAAETERPGALGRLYIGAMRYEPPNPVRNEPVNFYVTMLNRTGKEQNYPLCVEIYLPDKAKPLGTTDCNNVTIPMGASEVPVGFWIGTGIKQCIQLRARAVMKEQGGEERIPLTNLRGEQLWTDFGVCP
jgi:hypothetical protein